MKEFTIQSNEANQRFDKYLKKLLPNAGSGFLYKMLRKKNITLNGKKAEGTENLKQGDVVKLFFSDETWEKFSLDPVQLQKEWEALASLPMKGLKVIYEDTDILAADKPYNMLSQKAGEKEPSANERLLGYLIRSGQLTAESYKTFHPSVVNRLDRNTTGILLMGKTLAGSQQMSEALRDRSAHKFYRAIVGGGPLEDRHVKGYLKKDERNNRVSITEEAVEGADDIETAWRTIQRHGDYSLLEIELITGKTHQIRAHLASFGHPILGDPKYGDARRNQELRRSFGLDHQLLHACRLELADGRTILCHTPRIFDEILHS